MHSLLTREEKVDIHMGTCVTSLSNFGHGYIAKTHRNQEATTTPSSKQNVEKFSDVSMLFTMKTSPRKGNCTTIAQQSRGK